MSISSRGFNPRSILFFCCAVFFTSFLFGAVWFHNRVPLHRTWCTILLYDVYLVYLGCICVTGCCWRCCCSVCCYTAVVAATTAACCCCLVIVCWQNLLLVIESIPSVFFLFIQTQFTFNVRTPWQYCRIYGLDLPIRYYILGNYGHALS